jgi:hypothetical protein
MKQIKCSDKRITRESLANPFSNMTYHDRLVQAGAIDLRDNCIIEYLGNGYCRHIAIDESKLVK